MSEHKCPSGFAEGQTCFSHGTLDVLAISDGELQMFLCSQPGDHGLFCVSTVAGPILLWQSVSAIHQSLCFDKVVVWTEGSLNVLVRNARISSSTRTSTENFDLVSPKEGG